MSITTPDQESAMEGKLDQRLPSDLEKDAGNAATKIVLQLDNNEESSKGERDESAYSKNICCVRLDENPHQERVFKYKEKSYCYSKHVFHEMLMKDEATPHANEEISLKTAIKEYKPQLLEYLSRRGKAPNGIGLYPMKEFSDYNGREEGRKIVNLMKKWNYVLHPKKGNSYVKNHGASCSLGVAVAAVLHAGGKITNLTSYQSDLLHARISAGAVPGMWGLCMAVIVYQDGKVDIPPPSISPNTVISTVLQELSFETDLVEAVKFLTGRVHRYTQVYLEVKGSRSKRTKKEKEDLSWTEKLQAEIKQVDNLSLVLADLQRLTNVKQMLHSFLVIKNEKLSKLCALGRTGATLAPEVTQELVFDANLAMLKEQLAHLLSQADMAQNSP